MTKIQNLLFSKYFARAAPAVPASGGSTDLNSSIDLFTISSLRAEVGEGGRNSGVGMISESVYNLFVSVMIF